MKQTRHDFATHDFMAWLAQSLASRPLDGVRNCAILFQPHHSQT